MIAVIVVITDHAIRLFDAIRAHPEGTPLVIAAADQADIETHFAGLGLAALHPDTHFLGASQGGASRARNRAVAYVLENMPDIEALCFLPATAPPADWSLPRLRRLLRDHPAIDWFDATDDGDGPAAPLIEALADIRTAGSLVRRRVFAAGLRFRDGLPDPAALRDFRLAALARGFQGWHVKYPAAENPNIAWRTDPPGALEALHPWTGNLQWLLGAEHRTAPRFAIYLPDLEIVRLGSSADTAGETLPWADYIARFWAALAQPKTTHCGAIFVVTSSLNLQVLEDAGLLAWTLLDLETRLLGCEIACLSLRRNADHRLTIAAPTAGADPQAVLAAMAISTLRDRLPGGPDRVANRQMHLSQQTPYVDPPGDMVGELLKSVDALHRSPFATDSIATQAAAAGDWPALSSLSLLLRGRFGGAVLPPWLQRPGPELAFVLQALEAGPSEQAAVQIAGALRQRGYVVSLVLLRASTLRLPDDISFDRVFFLAGAEAPEAANLLSVFDAVLACNEAAALTLMHRLQQRRVITGAYVPRVETSETGRHLGDARAALAFESALDLVVAGSDECALLLHARGVASAKLVTVPDGMGWDDAVSDLDDALRRHLAARHRDRHPAPRDGG